jgi:hypothetical protein
MKPWIAISATAVALASGASAARQPEHWPPDITSFVGRVAKCGTPNWSDAAGRRQWSCDRLPADRTLLIARYRSQPRLVEVLNGHWIIEVQRVRHPTISN